MDGICGCKRRVVRGWGVRAGLTLVLAAILALILCSTVLAASATVVTRGPSDRKQIALTFDDNYRADRAVAVLRALQRHQVRATLFLVGSQVNATPSINAEIVKGMEAGLFEVGDHSWSHPQLPKLSTAGMRAEIGGGTAAFRKATGARTVPLFRPPYGATNATVAAVAGEKGFSHLLLWDVDPRDWAGPSAKTIADHVVNRAHNGAIVVLHLTAPHTAEAIPSMVTRLRQKGYELVTVSQMLKGGRLFFDVPSGTEAERAIARMHSLGFMSGYNVDYFGPYDTITRAQVAKVSVLVGGIHTEEIEGIDSPRFPDVPLRRDSSGKPLAYPFDFVQEAATAGLVVGIAGTDGITRFEPYRPITRVQCATILARMCRQFKGYPATAAEAGLPELTFSDVPEYAVADVGLVAGLGIMTGTAGQTFSPWAGALRAHVAMTMSRYLDVPVFVPTPGPDPASIPGPEPAPHLTPNAGPEG